MDGNEKPHRVGLDATAAPTITAATVEEGRCCRVHRDRRVREISRRRRDSHELDRLLGHLYPKITSNRPPALPEATRWAMANFMWSRHGWQVWECVRCFNVEPRRGQAVTV